MVTRLRTHFFFHHASTKQSMGIHFDSWSILSCTVYLGVKTDNIDSWIVGPLVPFLQHYSEKLAAGHLHWGHWRELIPADLATLENEAGWHLDPEKKPSLLLTRLWKQQIFHLQIYTYDQIWTFLVLAFIWQILPVFFNLQTLFTITMNCWLR